jgi:hypothetical protein
MPSVVYNSLARDILTGAVNFGSDTFRCMLVGAGWQPRKGG